MKDKAGEPEELRIDAADSGFKLEKPHGMGYWPEGGGIVFCVYRLPTFGSSFPGHRAMTRDFRPT